MDPADGSRAVSPLDAVAAAVKSRVAELQDLVVARNMLPAKVVPDLASVDAAVTALESQVKAIRSRLQEELDDIPRAKKLIEQSMKQQEKLQHMLANLPSGMHQDVFATPFVKDASRMLSESFDSDSTVSQVITRDFKIKEEQVAAPKKGREPAPRLYISAEELDSLSSYMRGRLTLEKVNIAINEVATYADANAHLVSCPKIKLSEDTWEKALELREVASTKEVKGKHFFLETDIKGPGLKLDHSGKAILTVLRHLGRINETRVGRHRVFILSKQA